jgi:hypothetical protein
MVSQNMEILIFIVYILFLLQQQNKKKRSNKTKYGKMKDENFDLFHCINSKTKWMKIIVYVQTAN